MFISCVAGDLSIPDQGAIQSVYSHQSSCPASGSASSASLFTFGDCIPVSADAAIKYGCDDKNITQSYYTTAECSGAAAIIYPFIPLGCAVTSSGVVDTECNAASQSVEVALGPREIAVVGAAQSALAAAQAAVAAKEAAVKEAISRLLA